MKLLTAAESRQIDLLSQQKYGVASYSLMTRAGEAVGGEIAARWSSTAQLQQGVLVVAGKGNNGGDGLVAARRLRQLGVKVRAVLLAAAASLKGDAARACSDYCAAGGELSETIDEAALRGAFISRPGIVIDAIFGTGL